MHKTQRTITDIRKYAFGVLLEALGIPFEGLSEIHVTVSAATRTTGQVVIVTKTTKEIG